MKGKFKIWLKIFGFISFSIIIISLIPVLTSLEINTLIVLILSAAIFIFLLLTNKKLLKQKSISLILKDILSAKIEGLYGFIGAIFILTLISWFADYFREKEYFLALTSLINIFNVGILFIRFYPLESRKNENTKKVLIMALSEFKGKEESFKEELEKGLLGQERLSSNWELPLRHIYEYRNTLEKIFFITSTQSYEDKEKFLKFLEIVLPDFKDKVIFENGIDFNDFEQIKKKLISVMDKIKDEGYKDEDLVVNISGGTSAMTLGLTLFALEQGRLITYFEQLPPTEKKAAKLIEFDVNKEDAIKFLKKLTLEE